LEPFENVECKSRGGVVYPMNACARDPDGQLWYFVSRPFPTGWTEESTALVGSYPDCPGQ
jgi:hypothetical protein